MPTNRKRITRKFHNLKDFELAFLRDDPQELPGWPGFGLWNLRRGHGGLGDDRSPKALWAEHKAEFLPEFIRKNPGRRPVAWWLYDSPRWDRKFGAWFDGTLMEPRKQLSGAGAAPWDAGQCVVPWHAYGLPCVWESYDPADPPRFESEVVYLERHGLLTNAEKKILENRPEAFESEVLDGYHDEKEGMKCSD